MANIVLNVTLNTRLAEKDLNALKNSLKLVADSVNGMKPSRDLTEQVKALAKYYDAIAKAAAESAKQQKSETEKTRKNLEKEAQAVDRLQKKWANLLISIQSREHKYPKDTFDNLKKKIRSALEEVKELNAEIRKSGEVNKKQAETLKKSGEEYEKVSADTATLTSETEKNISAVKQSGDSILSLAQKFLLWQISATIVMKPLHGLTSAIQRLGEILVETEDAAVAFRRVLKEDIGNSEIIDSLYDIARDFGQTFDNVKEIALNFARTGMSWQETLSATRAAVLALNVAELDATESSDGLIAIMTQFSLKAEDLTNVIDVLNKTADNFPVTSEKLLAAIQRTGSSAAQANLSLEQTVGLITALSKATGRSGENIGTALNALINYSTKSTALDTFASLSGDVAQVVDEYKKGAVDILEVWRAVSKEISHLTDQQADLLDQYFSTSEGEKLKDELSAELGDVYNDLSGVYSTANTFRKNYFIALLNNMDTVDAAIQTASDSSGYSIKENEQYLDTYTAKVNQLNAQWEELCANQNGILGLKKILVDILSGLITISTYTGQLRTLLIGAASFAVTALTKKIITNLEKYKSLLPTITRFQRLQENAIEATNKAKEKSIALDRARAAANDQVQATIDALKTAEDEYTEAINAQNAARAAQAGFILSWVGVGVTAISAIVGAIQQYREEEHQKRLETIQAWESEKDRAQSLDTLYKKYQTLDTTSGEYLTTEEQIVDLLGDKKLLLSDLTKGTEEYRKEVERLTEAEQKELKRKELEAAWAAEDELADYVYWAGYKQDAGISEYLPDGYAMQGRNVYSTESGFRIYVGDQESKNLRLNALLAWYDAGTEKLNRLRDEYQKAAAEYGSSSKEARSIRKEYESLEKDLTWNGLDEKIENYRKTHVEAEEEVKEATDDGNSSLKDRIKTLTDLVSQYGDITAALKAYQDEQKNSENLQSKQNALLEAQLELEQKIAEARRNYVLSTFEDYIDGLENTETIEEKKAAILEKQKALKEAMLALENTDKQRNVWEYNNRTGTFEWQAGQKDRESAQEKVAKAQEDVEKAIESLNDYLKKQAVSELKTAIKNGDTSSANINSILKKWLNDGEGLDIYEWGNDVAKVIASAVKSGRYNAADVSSAQDKVRSASSALQEYLQTRLFEEMTDLLSGKTGVSEKQVNDLLKRYKDLGISASDLDLVRNTIKKVTGITLLPIPSKGKGGSSGQYIAYDPANLPAYDNGGILSGMGGIKACEEDETVLSPELTKKILTPTSNEAFASFSRSLGLMFGASEKLLNKKSSGWISNVTHTTDNSDNRSYVVNGVPISPALAKNYPLTDIFKMLDLME